MLLLPYLPGIQEKWLYMVGLRVSGVAAVQGIYQKNVQDQITVGTNFYFIYFVLRGVGTEGHISDLGGYHFFM